MSKMVKRRWEMVVDPVAIAVGKEEGGGAGDLAGRKGGRRVATATRMRGSKRRSGGAGGGGGAEGGHRLASPTSAMRLEVARDGAGGRV